MRRLVAPIVRDMADGERDLLKERDDLELELREADAPTAPATILEAHKIRSERRVKVRRSRFNWGLADLIRWSIAARVEPPGAATFDVTFEQICNGQLHSRLQARFGNFSVLYDPADHQRMRIDTVAFKRDTLAANAQLQQQLQTTMPFTAAGGAEAYADIVRESVAGSGSVPSPLQQLETLREAGALTNEQFERAKAQLLGERP